MELVLHAPIDGWLSGLDDVPDPVFAERMLGDGVAIDPLGDTLYAPAAGTVASVHAAGHAVTLRLDGGVDLLMHVGLDTVKLAGRGFTPLVTAGDAVAVGTPLLRVALDQVAAGARSLVTPMVVAQDAGATVTRRAPAGLVRHGDEVLRLTLADQAAPAGAATAAPARLQVRVPLAHGLHARPCARLAALARTFDAEVVLVAERGRARATSPSGVLALGIAHDASIAVEATGPAAAEAVAAIAALIAGGMGEATAAPAPRPAPAAAPLLPRITPPAVATPGAVLTGVLAAPGLAMGPAWPFAPPRPEAPPPAPTPTEERARSDAARAAVRGALAAAANGGGEAAAIMAAQLVLLDDDDILALVHDAIARGGSGADAWRDTMTERAQALRAVPDARVAERAGDLLDLELRLQWALAGRAMPPPAVPAGAVVIAADLMPSHVAALDPATVGGIATAAGGPTSHVAIIAASRGIPALVAIGPAVLTIASGARVALDAEAGRLIVDPAEDEAARFAARRARHQARRAAAAAAAGEEGRTADGHRIEVFANLGSRDEAAPAVAAGAEGCGLLRTEFLFLDRAAPPSEEEQLGDYAAIVAALAGRPLVARLLDIGGDKPAPYLPMAREDNPALGVRGIRVGLARPEMLRPQLRALVRARAAGDVRVLVPMVARLDELRAVRAALAAEADALGLADRPPVGVMIETPAAAVMAPELAAACDFLSIGSNDLTQYVLATDRGNPALAAQVDALDPAVLRMIDLTCRGAAAHGRWVGVCGGLASDPLAVPILLGLGVRELSAAPAMVAPVKAAVRAVTLDRCRAAAAAALAAATVGEVRAVAAALAEEIGR